MRKILTLEDLVTFCAKGKLSRFSSSETGYSLRVRVPATYSKKNDDDFTLYGDVKIMHTGRNRNGSNLTIDAMNKCKDKIAYKPLLANFCEIDGVKDFTSHDFEVDENGEVVYEEYPIGCFTSDPPRIEYDKDKDRYYLYALCAIPKEYTAAAEIIERKGGTKVSAELAINEMSYDATEKELILEDVEVIGVTCLGVNPDTGEPVEEGMEGARLDIADFSSNKLTSYDIKILEEILNKYKNVENSTLQKGESMGAENQSLTSESVLDDDSNISIESSTADESINESVPEDTNESEKLEPENVEPEENAAEETVVSETQNEESINESSVDPAVEENASFSANLGDKVYTFKTSLQDELFALTQLVNDVYAEADNAYYMVDAYSDTKEVIMVDIYTGKAYKQSYKVKSGVYSLKGDRISVHARYVTDDEEKALDELKANYSVISDKLRKYEEEPKKMEILSSSDYGFIANTEDFIKLKEQTNHFDLSVEETKAKADEILLAAAKNAKFSFKDSEDSKKECGVIPFLPKSTKSVGRYGSMFVKD